MENKRKADKNFSEMKKDLPFKVPEKYFAELNTLVRERIRETEEGKNKTHTSRRLVWMGWAAGVAAVISGLIFILPGIGEDRNNPGLSFNDITYVLEEEIYDLDEFEIENALSQNQSTMNTDAEDYQQEIIQYLLDENIELESIVNEL